jgi:hypothetical protein
MVQVKDNNPFDLKPFCRRRSTYFPSDDRLKGIRLAYRFDTYTSVQEIEEEPVPLLSGRNFNRLLRMGYNNERLVN